MIYIYGDSHGVHSFKNLHLPHVNNSCNSITMFRIGRDNSIVNFDKNYHNKDSILCFLYGEIDCRCHIQKQINTGRNEDDIINELITNYFNTLKNNINIYKQIIIVGIIPPTLQYDYENLHGPILHEFPFVGTDNDRVRYTIKMNNCIQQYCIKNNYIYFNPYDYYTRDDGTLKYELSDSTVHLGDNSFFLKKFIELYETIV
uniref:SGNH hydrolase-type esterase domain-containing protein n=1 Tax=viral metagenome TaxID=1070528 RepID=A0A6C0D060_9ZZZZ